MLWSSSDDDSDVKSEESLQSQEYNDVDYCRIQMRSYIESLENNSPSLKDMLWSSSDDDSDVKSEESLQSQEYNDVDYCRIQMRSYIESLENISPSLKDNVQPMENSEENLPSLEDGFDTTPVWLFVCAIIVHFLLLFACRDLHFVSPLEHGMVPIKSIDNPPANRVVLFVADGLRADAIYGEKTVQRAPFLTNIRKKQGSWGISHVRPPTETRVGHGSILGGIYEDPSAIFNGWKANPVKFDSVINRSTETWSWGSPDVVRGFNKDDSSRFHYYSYSSDAEEEWENNSILLDEWVFDGVKSFLKTVMKNNKIYRQQKGIFFFLHLLGTDAAGHKCKPNSKQYIKNIEFVDKNMKDVVKLFQDTFKDNQTAFVFTSDHGRRDDGHHGGGSQPETESPIIVWGAGIKINNTRQDINQIDIAPLLATLIGINIPVNSLGILPQNYLNVQEEDLVKMQLNNILQLLEILRVKQKRIEDHAIYFVPYKGFTADEIKTKVKNLTEFIRKGNFENFRNECSDFIKIIIGGVQYYHNYYQMYLFISVSVGFVAWMIFLLSFVVADQPSIWRDSKNVLVTCSFLLTLLIVIIICYIQNFPLFYYGYFSFPIAMIYLNIGNREFILNLIKQVKSIDKHFIVSFILYTVGLGLLVLCFFDRWPCFVLMMLLSIWIFNSYSLIESTNIKLKVLWCVICIFLTLFSLLSVFKVSFNRFLYIIGICLWILPLLLYRNTVYKYFFEEQKKITKIVLIIQYSLTLLAFLYIIGLDYGLFTEDSILQFIPWLLLILPIILVPLTETIILTRLVSTVLAFLPFYILVAPDSFETIFLYFFISMLFIWLKMESTSTEYGTSILDRNFESYQSEHIHFRDSFRRGFCIIVVIFIGFFGPGNTVSLNLFDPMSTRVFLIVHSPFKMMGLIVLKIIIPFIFTCCVFRSINFMLKENVSKVFYIILLLSDVIVLQFFYLVTNEGSWLDIGSSLSHFIVMETFIIILLLLYFISYLLTSFSYYSFWKIL